MGAADSLTAPNCHTRTVIVGGGIAGLTCAIALCQRGIRPVLYEQTEPLPTHGVGFLLMPNGLAVLDQLGLGSRVRDLGQRAFRATRLDTYGNSQGDKAIAEHLCLRRSDLIELLKNEVPAGVIAPYQRCQTVSQSDAGVRVTFKDGSTVDADLLVGADGNHSVVRHSVFPRARMRNPRVEELIAIAECPSLAGRLNRRLLKISDPGGGLAVGMAAMSATQVLWYIQYDAERVSQARSTPDDRLQLAMHLVGSFPSPVPGLIARTDFARCFLAGTTDLDPLPSLIFGRVALLGDAGHTVLTLTSQGANGALEDALSLATHVSEQPLHSALKNFDQERRQTTEGYILSGRDMERDFLAKRAATETCPPPPKPEHCMIKNNDWFADDKVNLTVLRQRAFNHRWAVMPEDVIVLTAADPDFPTAPVITEAVKAYCDAGPFSYGPAEGIPSFRAAAARVCTERYAHIGCAPERVLATDSVASGMYVVARWALSPGDEAIIFDPGDFLFQRSVEAAGARPVRVAVDAASGQFDVQAIRAAVTPRTRMIAICNPHNPVGRAMEESLLREICAIAIEHDLIIMSDEIWCDIVFPPHRHVAVASLSAEIAARTVSLYGFSKSFGLAGLRVGYLTAPSDKAFTELLAVSQAESTAFGCVTLSQIAAQAAYEHGWPWFNAFLGHLNTLRDYAVERLNAMPGVSCRAPEGTYLLFPDVSSFGRTSRSIAEHLLQNARVAVVPGAPEFFGPGAEGHLRIAFPTSRAILTEGLDRIEAGLRSL